MRINAGEIQVLRNDAASTVPKNDGVINTIDMSAGSSKWWAIDGTAATVAACFVTPGSANTVKYATSGSAAQTLVLGSGAAFEGMASYVTGAGALMTLKVLGLMPVASLLGGTIASPAANGDGFWVDVTGEKLPLRLGSWGSGATAGLSALHLDNVRSNAYDFFGARPGFVR